MTILYLQGGLLKPKQKQTRKPVSYTHLDVYKRQEKNLILNVPQKYRYNSAALARATAPDLVGWVREAGASKDGPEIGLLTWACHNIWLEYRYSMDKEILKKLFPILKRSDVYKRQDYNSCDGIVRVYSS